MTASNVATARQRGTLIKLPDGTPGLLIVGTEQKSFVLEGTWRSPTPPSIGLTVDVELSAEGAVAAIHAVDAQQAVLEQGQRAADVARRTALLIVGRIGKPALIALAVLWLGWFFLPALDWGVVSFTYWELLGLDTSNLFTLARGSKPGLASLLGLAAIAAPLAAPFVASPRARWLYAAPFAFVLVCVLRAGLGLYRIDDAASSGASALGGRLTEAVSEMQAAARQAMLKEVLSGLGAGLWLTVLASGALAIRALQGSPAKRAAPTAGTAPLLKSLDRRVAMAVGASAAVVAAALGAVTLVSRALQSPRDTMTALFRDLTVTIEDTHGNCPKLGEALTTFIDERGDDFRALGKLPAAALKEMEPTFLLEQQKAQNAIGNSYMLCANYREFAEGSRAVNDTIALVQSAILRADPELAAGSSAGRRSTPAAPAAPTPEPSFWDKWFSSAKQEQAPSAAPAEQPRPAVSPPQARQAAPTLPPPVTQPPAHEVVLQPAAIPTAALPSPALAVATATAATAATLEYAVFDVHENDVLNARFEPRFGAPKAFDISPGETGLAGGKPHGRPGDQWVEIVRPDVSGWVNRSFLVEHRSNPCADARVPLLGEKLAQAVERRDGARLGSLVSPIHGLEIRGDIAHAGARFNGTRTAQLFESTTSHAWGGSTAKGTFKDTMLPLLVSALGAAPTWTCGRIVQPASSTKPSVWPVELSALLPLSLSSKQAGDDSATWVLGIEFVDGAPSVATLTHYAPATRPVVAAPPPLAVSGKAVPATATAPGAAAKRVAKEEAKPAAALSVPAPEAAAVEEQPKRKGKGKERSRK